MILSIFKGACLAAFALGLAGLAGLLPAGLSGWAQMVALALLLVHIVELLFAFRFLRLYRGPLWASVGLTLLYGLLHWKPLADGAARARASQAAER